MLMAHNIPVYKNLTETIKKHNKAIIVTTMGTGKSYLVKEYLDENNLNALVVCPTLAICENWKSLTDRVTTVTYQAFQRHEFPGYDCYVFDEAHHSGSTKWGAVIRDFMNKTDKPVIGLTADPVRYMDNKKNVADELWEGTIVKGYTMGDAVEMGILPPVLYVYSLFGLEDIKKNYALRAEQKNDATRKILDKLLKRFDFSAQNVNQVENILKKYSKTDTPKGVIFTDSISRIDEAIETVKKAYPDAKFWNISSRSNSKTNLKQLEEFNKSSSGFITAIEMLNEGLHVEGVNTVVMFRRTQSPTVYFQQMGRAMSASGSDQITIFDFVGNKENIKEAVFSSGSSEEDVLPAATFFEKTFRSSSGIIPKQVILQDCTGDICSICKEIEDVLSEKWTKAEDDILREYYPSEGTSISKRLPRRSVLACRARADLLGIKNNRFVKWDDKSDDIIRKYYPTEGGKCSKRLTNGADRTSIASRAYLLGVKFERNVWTDEDIAFIKANFSKLGSGGCAEALGRTKASCQSKARDLKLAGSQLWTEKEIALVRDNYAKLGPQKTSELVGTKSPSACLAKANQLGIIVKKFKWTPELDEFLKENYYNLTTKELAAEVTKLNGEFDISKDTIQRRCQTLGLKGKAVNPLSDDEKKFIKDNYKTMSSTKMGEILHRSVGTVATYVKNYKKMEKAS